MENSMQVEPEIRGSRANFPGGGGTLLLTSTLFLVYSPTLNPSTPTSHPKKVAGA